jgi:hypothetical protein
MNPGMHSRVKAFLRKRNDPKETNVFHDEGKSFAHGFGNGPPPLPVVVVSERCHQTAQMHGGRSAANQCCLARTD